MLKLLTVALSGLVGVALIVSVINALTELDPFHTRGGQLYVCDERWDYLLTKIIADIPVQHTGAYYKALQIYNHRPGAASECLADVVTNRGEYTMRYYWVPIARGGFFTHVELSERQ